MIDIHYRCPEFRGIPSPNNFENRQDEKRYRQCVDEIAEGVSELLVPKRSYIVIFDLDYDCSDALMSEMRERFDDLHPDSAAFDAAFERAYTKHYQNPSKITFKAVPYLLGDITHADPEYPSDSVQLCLWSCTHRIYEKKLKERYMTLIYRENAEWWAKK